MNAKNSNVNNSKSFLPVKSVYVLLPLFVLLFILAFASSMCTTVSAVYGPSACPCETKYTGTIHGGIYYGSYELFDDPPRSATFEGVPDKEKVKIARIYTGIWRGSPGKGGTFNITANGHTSIDYLACDPCPGTPCNDSYEHLRCDTVNTSECHDYVTGCNVQFVTYNATPYIKTGTNNVTVWSDCPPAGECVCGDGRIYGIALVVVYEDPSMPEITYWLNEGHAYMDVGSSCSPHADEAYIYFNGTIYPGSVSDLKYWALAPTSGPSVSPELNGKYIGEFGAQPSPYAWESMMWDNIPPGYLATSSNLFYYYDPEAEYDRIGSAVLMLNYSDPSDLNVTDVSPESLCVDWYNTIDATIVNNGPIAYFFNVTLYVNDAEVDVHRMENLGEGENRTVKFMWKPDHTGPYVLNVTVDAENMIKETDETNNSKTLDVTVTEAQPPEWSSQSSNVTEIPNGGYIELRAQGKADVGLKYAILSTDETGTGTWINHTNYGSPMDMASYHNYSFTHTTDSDWNAQELENVSACKGDAKLSQFPGTTNISMGKPSYASSEYKPADRGNDGINDYDHSWRSLKGAEYMPCWWYVDLEEVKDVAEIRLYGRTYCTPLHYKILISDDNETWTSKIDKGYSGASDTEPDNHTNLAWSCRYINVTIITNEYGGGREYGGFNEFEVYPAGDYKSNGTLTSKTFKTYLPIVSVIPEWNLTKPEGTSFYVNISVDNGATWKNATNGTELIWNYDGNNTKLKYKVLFETTNLSRTPVLHDISLNYTTKDPIESEWLWSNFTWHNDSITCTTVGWKIYYEDMLGNTNCTAVKTFDVGDSWLQTTDVDFNAGTKTNINVSDDAFRLNSSNTTVFDDGFEVDITTNWTVSANWDRDGSVTHSGTYSAKLGNAEGNLDTKARDCSGAQAIYADFWYHDNKADAGDFDLQYWNGAIWNTIADLAVTTPENTWHNYQQKITDSQYFISDFKIRFAGSPDGGESIWVDDMKIIKESFVTGNLISQAHNTGVGEPSYTDIIVGNSTPGGTAITTEVRAASDQGGLSSATWYNDIANVPHEQWVQWRVNLTGDGTNTPTVYDVTINWMCGAGVANVVVTPHNVSFGNMLAGDNTTIYVSLTLNNSEGTAAATIEAVFKTNVSVVYGLNGTFGSNIIPGNYFELGLGGNEKALTNTTTKRFISTLDAGATVDYNAILIVPAGQAADDYSGIVELSW
jgi:hypothetical protein